MSEIIVPTFYADDFLFDGSIPHHVNEKPVMPRCPDYTYGVSRVTKSSTAMEHLAVDLPDITMAHRLAEARIAHQELTVRMYGESEALWVVSHNRIYEVAYNGLKNITAHNKCIE